MYQPGLSIHPRTHRASWSNPRLRESLAICASSAVWISNLFSCTSSAIPCRSSSQSCE